MKNSIYILLFLLFSISLISCEIGPEPISYGEDGCQFCKMTIVDRQHAAELVTSKGKVYKFDAIECMINYRKEHDEIQYALYLVNDFSDPSKLIDATMATYLISEQISSPMGANLAAFAKEDSAIKNKEEYTGDVYTWQQLPSSFNAE